MYEKIGKFLKDWWPFVLGVLSSIGGFFAGRYTRRGTSPDIEKLREHNRKLREQLSEAGKQLKRIKETGRTKTAYIEELERQRSAAEQTLEQLEQQLKHGGKGTEQLRENNERLSDWIQKYGDRLSKIEETE